MNVECFLTGTRVNVPVSTELCCERRRNQNMKAIFNLKVRRFVCTCKLRFQVVWMSLFFKVVPVLYPNSLKRYHIVKLLSLNAATTTNRRPVAWFQTSPLYDVNVMKQVHKNANFGINSRSSIFLNIVAITFNKGTHEYLARPFAVCFNIPYQLTLLFSRPF